MTGRFPLTDEEMEELLWGAFHCLTTVGFEAGAAVISSRFALAGLDSSWNDRNVLLERILDLVSDADLESLDSVVGSHKAFSERLRELGRYLDRHHEYLEKQAKLGLELHNLGGSVKELLLDHLLKYRGALARLLPEFAEHGIEGELGQKIVALVLSRTRLGNEPSTTYFEDRLTQPIRSEMIPTSEG